MDAPRTGTGRLAMRTVRHWTVHPAAAGKARSAARTAAGGADCRAGGNHGVGSGRVGLDGPGQPADPARVAGTARGLPPAATPARSHLPPTVSVGNGPDGLALDPATHTLYTSNQNDSSVSVINTATCNARTREAAVSTSTRCRCRRAPARRASPSDTATGTIYVANIGGNSISVINARTCNAINFSGCRQTPASIKDPGGPIALAVDQATDTVYVANIGDNFSGTSHTVRSSTAPPATATSTPAAAQTPRQSESAPARTALPSTRPPTRSTWPITAPPTTATPSR